MSNKGTEFEEEWAEEFGLKRVPGSGSTWHSKGDVAGNQTRWFLKYRANSLRIDRAFVDEALNATSKIGGTGEIPLWAIRLGDGAYDLVIIRKEDFKAMQSGELKVLPEVRTKTKERERLADIPVLLRD